MSITMAAMLDHVRKKAPLIHSITNYVTINGVANIILACGGSPIMSDNEAEVEEITARCSGLDLNIGTLSQCIIHSMILAGRKANALCHPVLLDPVGAGASSLRTETAEYLMREVHFEAIRGSISEIKALASARGCTGGMEAVDAVTDNSLNTAVQFVKAFSAETGSIIAITGAVDLVGSAEECYMIRNGRPEMGRITGTGCQLSGMMTTFLAANPEDRLEAAAAAACAMGLAGEIGWRRMQPGDGNAAYCSRIIDAVCNMTSEQLEEGANYEVR